MSTAEIIRKHKQSKHLDKIATELQRHLALEQAARQAFWAEAHEDTRAEWIMGRAVLHSPVKGRHFITLINLMGIMIPHVQANRLGQLTVESTAVACGRNDFMPDIAFWREERRGEIGMESSDFPAPDFVVEILSNSTEKLDRGLKMDGYAEAGVQEYWLVDPRNLSVEVYYPSDDGYLDLHQTYQGGVIEARVIKDLQVPIKQVFAGID